MYSRFSRIYKSFDQYQYEIPQSDYFKCHFSNVSFIYIFFYNFLEFQLIKSGFLLLICAMSMKTMERSKEWLNENSLYSSGVVVCPLNAKVHYNLAKNAADLNNFSLAEKEYDEAIR